MLVGICTCVAKRLNAAGGKAISYNAGDQVMVYVPTRGDAKSGWKAKHTIQARGPCTVQQRLGASTYKVFDPLTKRSYTRSVAHLTPLSPTAGRTRYA